MRHKIHTHASEIKTLFTYKHIGYSYIVVEGEPIPFKVSGYKDNIELDDEMQAELDSQLEAFEATLSEKEMKIWLGQKVPDNDSNIFEELELEYGLKD